MTTKTQAVTVENDRLPVQTSRERVMAAAREMARDSSDVSEKIMANILDAPTADDVFESTSGEAAGLIRSEDRYGVPLTIREVALNESTFNEGPPAYAVIEATNLRTGEDETIACGASNVVAGLIKLHQLNALPIDVVIFESSKRTANGFYVTLMRRATDADKVVTGEKF